jgi:hypothetical protein
MGPEFTWDGDVPANLKPKTSMAKNRISITITPQQEAAILAKGDEFIALIDAFCVSLTEEERARLFKLGDSRLAFDQKCDNYLHQRGDLVPPGSDLPEYDKDGSGMGSIKRMLAKVGTATGRLTDTLTLLGSDRMDMNLLFFNHLKFAGRMGLSGAEAIHDDLQESYPGRGPTEKPATPTT